MSKRLINLSKKVLELTEESIQISNQLEQSEESKKKYLSDKLDESINEIKRSIIEYSQELKDISKKHKEKTKKLKVRKQEIKEFVKSKRLEKDKREEKYKVYQSNIYSKISNFFMENLSFTLSKKYKEPFKKLSEDIALADLHILSKTYLSIILFTTIISFPIITLLSFIFTKNILISLPIGILGSIITFFALYKYPSYESSIREKMIRTELVFALFHMSAIASSGTKPIKIFQLLLDSKEYKYLQPEFKRVVNYINIFGYNLTTSLKAVASTSASPDFREFLHGMASTIETGGGIKEYLRSKADDALVKYRLEQEKYSELIATYSEIYTGLLIAAPLLFVVTFAILERISPTVGGMSINTIAMLGIFLLLPLLNIIFMLFLEASKVGK
jgi:Flp pilus assembly protein TadB